MYARLQLSYAAAYLHIALAWQRLGNYYKRNESLRKAENHLTAAQIYLRIGI